MTELVPFRPRRGFKVSPRYLSRILSAYAGEQRLSLRTDPRTVLELSFELSGADVGRARRMARRIANDGGRFLFPDWRMWRRFDIPAGSASFVMHSAAFFTVGGKAVILTADNRFLERTVADITGNTVTLDEGSPLEELGGAVLPLFECVATTSFSFNVMSSDRATLSVSAISEDSADHAGTFLTNYGGVEVFDGPRYKTGSLNETIFKPQTFIDDGTGPIAVEPTKTYIDGTLTLMIEGEGVDELADAEAFFRRRLGRVKPFFVALETDDFELDLDRTQTAGKILVTGESNSSEIIGQRLAIDLADGTRHFCEVTDAQDFAVFVTEFEEWTELTLSPARPSSEPIGVSELAYCRCDSDEFVFELDGSEGFIVTTNLKRLDHEL